MKYQILAVGLKEDMLDHCRGCFAKSSVELKNVISISEAVRILEREAPQLLVLDMDHLRSIGQTVLDWEMRPARQRRRRTLVLYGSGPRQ